MLSAMTPSIPITTSSVWSHPAPPPALSTESALHIESAEAMQAACELAERLGTSVDDAVAFALRAQLRRERAQVPSAERRLQAIHEFVTTLAEMPTAGDPTVDPASSSGDGAGAC